MKYQGTVKGSEKLLSHLYATALIVIMIVWVWPWLWQEVCKGLQLLEVR